MIVIKPPAIARGIAVATVRMIIQSGLHIVSKKSITLNEEEATRLYTKHIGRDYEPWLIEQITSGPCLAILVEGDNAAKRARDLAGPTAPEKARETAPDSIRAKLSPADETFARSREELRAVDNAVHTPDPDEPGAVERETKIFFP